MYTILVKPDDTLVTTNREPIYHRESLIHKLRFLVDPEYKDGDEILDMRGYVCTLEYKTPISETYIPVILTPSVNLYKEKVEYLLPIDTAITSEVGNVELKLSWIRLEVGDDGGFKERVRKTPVTTLEILPVAQWGDYVADSKLDILAQVLLKNQAQNEQMKAYAEQIQQLAQYNAITKADNIRYNEETKTAQLESMGAPIGREIVIGQDDCNCEEGVPVVDFTVIDPDDETDESKEVDNVVEF